MIDERNVSGIFAELEVSVRDKFGNLKQVYVEKPEPVAKIFQRITIRDRDGNVRSDEEKECHSYTKQFLQLLECMWRAGYVTIKDVSNTNRSTYVLSRGVGFYFGAADDLSTYGIVVGTSNAAESNIDYHLTTQVAHGIGAGQLDYGAMGFVDPYVVGTNVDFVMTRSFYNGSGGNITCYEFGIYAEAWGNSICYYCILRDMEAAGKTVNDGDTMTVQYTLRVSSGFTIAFWETLHSLFSNVTEVVEDTGNIARSIIGIATPNLNDMFHVDSADNDSNYGIVVGTGTNAESLTDYALQTKIAHGVGVGQLDYQGHNWTTTGVVGANVDLIASRNYYNGSGNTITINEIAIYSRSFNGVYYYFCIIRDKLSAGVDIANLDTGTVQYTLRTNVAT